MNRKIKYQAWVTAFILVVFSALPASHVWAADRHALVIGIAQYERARDLRNPVDDARAVAMRLEGLGFTLYGGEPLIDPDRATLMDAFIGFAGALPDGADVVVYVAGHGLTHNGNSYLIPSDDGELAHRADLVDHAVPLHALTGRLAGRTSVDSLILVDTCSANGLRASGLGGEESGAGGSGDLVASPSGSMSLIYAAAPGQIAADGEDEHSPFAQALLDTLPQTDPYALFSALSQQMARDTDSQQTPWMMQALGVGR